MEYTGSYPAEEGSELSEFTDSLEAVTAEHHQTKNLEHLNIGFVWHFVEFEIQVATECRNQVSSHDETEHKGNYQKSEIPTLWVSFTFCSSSGIRCVVNHHGLSRRRGIEKWL